MRRFWDHFAIVLYLAGVILCCLVFVYGRPEKEAYPEMQLRTPAPAAETETVSVSFHQPRRSISHIYGLDAAEAEPVSAAEGMLKLSDMVKSRYYSEPAGEYEHVYREENGIYDCFVYGTGSVGDLDAYAKYVFRYDGRTGKAASFVQEQHISTGTVLNGNDLSVFASNTGNLLEAVFSGTDIRLSADKRKIEELALYFFSSYIPSHPSVPAVLHFRLPSYILSFVMDADVFITMISPEKVPAEYIAEDETD